MSFKFSISSENFKDINGSSFNGCRNDVPFKVHLPGPSKSLNLH